MRFPLVIAATIAAAAPAQAQSVVFEGRLNCEASASANVGASHARATVTRTGSQVLFERPLFNQRTRQVVGRESGTGMLEGGRFTIRTEGNAGATTMRGRYEGTLTDTELQIRGTRQWTLHSGVGDQSCSGTFKPKKAG